MQRLWLVPVTFLIGAIGVLTPPVAAQRVTPGPDTLLPLTSFSPSLLGMYRKVIQIEGELQRFTKQYGLDLDLARAVVIHESGGNGSVVSVDGANGYFQVMPATFRSLHVDTNIEAGIKYLSQQVKRFGREDYALAAYNTGPGRVSRKRPMYLETLQYVLGVGHFRNVLKTHESSLRYHANQIQLTTVAEGDDWWQLSQRLNLSILQLRLENAYIPLHFFLDWEFHFLLLYQAGMDFLADIRTVEIYF